MTAIVFLRNATTIYGCDRSVAFLVVPSIRSRWVGSSNASFISESISAPFANRQSNAAHINDLSCRIGGFGPNLRRNSRPKRGDVATGAAYKNVNVGAGERPKSARKTHSSCENGEAGQSPADPHDNNCKGCLMEPGWIGVFIIIGFVALFALLNLIEKGSID